MERKKREIIKESEMDIRMCYFAYIENNCYYATQAVYTLHPDGPMISANRNGTYYYYHYDPMGNIAFLTNVNGTTTANYVMDSFGNLISKTGTDGGNRTYYAGLELDADINLYLLEGTVYDPNISRTYSIPFRGDYASISNPIFYKTKPTQSCDTVWPCERPLKCAFCELLPFPWHAYLCLSGPNRECWGFYPSNGGHEDAGTSWKKGRVSVEGYNYWFRCSIVLVDKDKKKRIRMTIQHHVNNPPDYHWFYFNCYSWNNYILGS